MELGKLFEETLLSLPFIAAGAWLMREVFKLYLNRDLESFKSRLEKEAISHRIRYEEFHGQRVAVIRDTFQKLCDMYEALNEMFRLQYLETGQKERLDEAFNKAQDFRRYVDKNQLFFSEEQFTETMAIYNDVDDKVWAAYHYAKTVTDPAEATEELRSIWKHLKDEAPIIKKNLASTFRGVVGIGE